MAEMAEMVEMAVPEDLEVGVEVALLLFMLMMAQVR
jgi:hypothetical protein